MKQNMTTGSPMSIILRFMIPLFIGNLFQQIYNTVDTIIVGRYLGENALAAVGSTGTLMFLIIGFANGLCTGFTVLTSQKFGETQRCDGRTFIGDRGCCSDGPVPRTDGADPAADEHAGRNF